jgi:hypothetical protein
MSGVADFERQPHGAGLTPVKSAYRTNTRLVRDLPESIVGFSPFWFGPSHILKVGADTIRDAMEIGDARRTREKFLVSDCVH